MANASPRQILTDLWAAGGGDTDALSRVVLTGDEPALPSSFRVGAIAQASIAAAGLAAAEIWRLRSGRSQSVSVDMRHAAIEFRSERHARIAGQTPPPLWDKIAGVYSTGDGRWVRLHTNFPHHRDGILKLLQCAYEREAVQASLLKWNAEPFETAAADAKLTLLQEPDFALAWYRAYAETHAPLVVTQRSSDGELLGLDRIEVGRRRVDRYTRQQQRDLETLMARRDLHPADRRQGAEPRHQRRARVRRSRGGVLRKRPHGPVRCLFGHVP